MAPHLLFAVFVGFEDVVLTLELIFSLLLWGHVVIGGAPIAITMTPGTPSGL